MNIFNKFKLTVNQQLGIGCLLIIFIGIIIGSLLGLSFLLSLAVGLLLALFSTSICLLVIILYIEYFKE